MPGEYDYSNEFIDSNFDALRDENSRIRNKLVDYREELADLYCRIYRLEQNIIGKPQVNFRKVHPLAKTPTYAHLGDSGADLYAIDDVDIPAGCTRPVRTGIVLELPDGYEAQIRSKSGLALRCLTVANSPGTVDSSFRGEIVCIMRNDHLTADYFVIAGEKIAQIVVSPAVQARFTEVSDINSDTERGTSGFGSTGA